MKRECNNRRHRTLRMAASGLALTTALSVIFPDGPAFAELFSGRGDNAGMSSVSAAESGEKVILRIANWEEYIDEGGWDEEEAIGLDDRAGTTILGENSMVEDFEEWYFKTYGVDVDVEYSTFGTNEDLYNQLTLGNNFDLVCPSEYMFMKLIAEDRLPASFRAFF